MSVNLSIDVLENPKTHPKLEVNENSEQVQNAAPSLKMTQVKFSASRDKFLQFKQDI